MASMASKLTNFATSRKIPMWFSRNSYISTFLCAKPVDIPPETHQNAPKINEFDPKTRSLKNILTPESLIRALDSAPDLNSSIEIFRWASLHKRFRHTADTYSWMIFKVGMDGNGEEFDVLCREMANERCPNSEEAFGGNREGSCKQSGQVISYPAMMKTSLASCVGKRCDSNLWVKFLALQFLKWSCLSGGHNH